MERSVGSLSRCGIVLHFCFKRGIDELLDGPQCAKAGGQLHDPDAALLQRIANLAVEHDIGAAELIDRLLGIADHEQLAGFRRDLAPVRLRRIVRGEQQQDLRLQRIGILKFVDEDMREAVLQIAAHFGLFAHQIAREQQQIDKIQFACAPLSLS